MLAHLHQPAAFRPRDVRGQRGFSLSNADAENNAGTSRDASYAVKDYIRAQVERRWYIDRTVLKARRWTVSIHIRFSPDGTVRSAEIVGNGRRPSDDAYFNFALSARDAVLVSSPLALPPGTYAIAKDIVIDFNSRRVSR